MRRDDNATASERAELTHVLSGKPRTMLYVSDAAYAENLNHQVLTAKPSADFLRRTRKIIGAYSSVLPAVMIQPIVADSTSTTVDGIAKHAMLEGCTLTEALTAHQQRRPRLSSGRRPTASTT